MDKNVLIGVAWPYVNGDLHIGHLAGYLLPADICARYNRIVGNDVLMVSGSDCFGTPITVEAEKRELTPQDIVDEYHEKDVDLFLNKLNLTYDLYTKTQDENHIKVTQDIFIKMLEDGFIIVDTQEQYYSPKDDKFLPDRYVVGTCPYCDFEDSRSDQCDNCGKLIGHGELIDPVSTLTKESVELKESDHYFVDWSALNERLREYVDRVSGDWKEWVKNETYGWLNEGLRPRAITRDIEWGVPIPVDRIPEDKLVTNPDKKRIYVWFDAVIGYHSASLAWAEMNGGDWEKFWFDDKADKNLKHYYYMGKDNLVFHTMFWPGQLMTYNPDLHLPDVVSINMFLDFGGKQFSKSRGVTIPIEEFVEEFGNDATRFYLTLIMPEVRDSSFKWDDFEEKINGILVANLGNFIHRVLSIGKKTDSGDLEDIDVWEEVSDRIVLAFENSVKRLENSEFRAYLNEIMELSAFGNSIVDREKLWELKKTDEDRFKDVLKQLYVVIMALKYLMNPLLPHGSEKLAKMTSTEVPGKWEMDDLVGIFSAEADSIELNDLKPLFEKLEGVAKRNE